MKKPIYIYAIALVIAGLMISGATAGFTNPVSEKNTATKTIPAATMTMVPQVTQKAFAQEQQAEKTVLKEDERPTWVWMHKYEPAIAESHDGVVFSAHRFHRDTNNYLGHCGSVWDAKKELYYQTSAPGTHIVERRFNLYAPDENIWYSIVYYQGYDGNHHPAADFRGFWDTTRLFVSTFVPPTGLNDGNIFIVQSGNHTVPNVDTAYNGSYWSFGTSGFSGIKSVDVACDTTDTEYWRWGIQSLIISNDSGLQDGPALFFQYNSTGYGTISYFIISGAETTHCDIDEETQMAYSVYDYYSAEYFQYQLFVRTDNWAEMKQYTGGLGEDWTTEGVTWYFEDPVLGIREPAVAAGNGNVLVVTEITNDSAPDDHDIICWYTPDGNASNLETSVVAGSLSSEKHPEIQWVSENSFICAFWMNGGVYYSRSNDGGATWSEPVLASGTDVVYEGHGCIDISNGGTKIIWTKIVDANNWVLNVARLESRLHMDSDMIWDAADTCPRGDLTHYKNLEITIIDQDGNPVSGVPSSAFAFTVIPETYPGLKWIIPYVPQARWYGTFGCVFTAIDSVTDANGIIRFSVRPTTSIKGDILVTATVNGQPIDDVERIPCRSLDDDLNGAVSGTDFVVFGQDWTDTWLWKDPGAPDIQWRTDYTNDGIVSGPDFVMFGQHWSH